MTEPTDEDIERAQLAAHKATGSIVSGETVRAILKSYIAAHKEGIRGSDQSFF